MKDEKKNLAEGTICSKDGVTAIKMPLVFRLTDVSSRTFRSSLLQPVSSALEEYLLSERRGVAYYLPQTEQSKAGKHNVNQIMTMRLPSGSKVTARGLTHGLSMM